MRKLHLQITIALRNIFRQPRRSFLTIFAISFSVFCIIIFQALKVGLHQKMIDGSLGLDTGTIQIHASEYQTNAAGFKPLPELKNLQKTLAENGLAIHSSMRIKEPALIMAGNRSSSVLLSGIEAETEKRITFISSKLVAGDYVTPGTNSILIGRRLAQNLRLKIGDSVSLMLQDVNGQPVMKHLTVSGLYDTGLSSFDLRHLYLNLATLQDFLMVNNQVSEITLSTKPAEAERLAAQLTADLGKDKYQITSWQEITPDLVQLIELNDATFRLLVLIIFFIVAMGIANTMNSVIFERFREFGTIAAIGSTPAEIVMLVSLESLFLGIFACMAGTMISLLVSLYLNIHGIDLSHFTSSNQYFAAGSVLHAFVLPRDIVSANLITLITAIAAGLYPAIKASRLNPVDALNYN